MRATFQKIIVALVAVLIGWLSYRLQENNDFLWSIRYAIIPAIVTMLTLYVTLSMSLVKSLDEIAVEFRERAMQVVEAMKFEIRLELIVLLITFALLILHSFLSEGSFFQTLYRCIIDVFIVIGIVNFIIAIIDTFFGYLDLIKAKNRHID